jgi:hypothetical protein
MAEQGMIIRNVGSEILENILVNSITCAAEADCEDGYRTVSGSKALMTTTLDAANTVYDVVLATSLQVTRRVVNSSAETLGHMARYTVGCGGAVSQSISHLLWDCILKPVGHAIQVGFTAGVLSTIMQVGRCASIMGFGGVDWTEMMIGQLSVKVAPHVSMSHVWKVSKVFNWVCAGLVYVLVLNKGVQGMRWIMRMMSRKGPSIAPANVLNPHAQEIARKAQLLNYKLTTEAAVAATVQQLGLETPQDLQKRIIEVIETNKKLHDKVAEMNTEITAETALAPGDVIAINQNWRFVVKERAYCQDYRPHSDRVVRLTSSLMYRLRLQSLVKNDIQQLLPTWVTKHRMWRLLKSIYYLYLMNKHGITRTDYYINHESLVKTRRFLDRESMPTSQLIEKDLSVNAMHPLLIAHGIQLNRDGGYVMRAISRSEITPYYLFLQC